MAVFNGKIHTLPATHANCVELIKLAKHDIGLKQIDIARETTLSSTQLSNFMSERNIYPKSAIATLATYFSRTLKQGPELIDKLHERNTKPHRIEHSLENTGDFAVPLYTFFNVRDINDELKDLQPAFYVCYKKSQRFRSESNDDQRKIIKSILMVQSAGDRSKLIFEDNQLDGEGGHEVTHGVILSMSQNIEPSAR